jgi:ABC-type multidrug transport system fused ATPase/permease subunit
MMFEAAGRFHLERIGERISYRQRRRYASHVLRLPVAELDEQRVGDLVSRGTADASPLREIPRSVNNIAVGLLTLVTATGLMYSVDPLLVVIVLPITTSAFIASNALLRKMQEAARERQSHIGLYAAGLDRALTAIRTIKVFRAENRCAEEVARAASDAFQAGIRTAKVAMLAIPIVHLAATGSLLTVLVVGAIRVADGRLTIGELVTLFLFTLYAVVPMTTVFDGLLTIRSAIGANQRLDAVLQRAVETCTSGATVPSARITTRRGHPLVSMDGVSFHHGAHLILDRISFEMRANQMTALVGPSGGGKTSLLALVSRLYEPSSGTMTLDGIDYRQLTTDHVRRQLSIVEQDTPILFGSIRENLLLGAPACTDEQMWRELDRVNLGDTVRDLPRGLDAAVLDHGQGLSGGQRQRLAIARALLSPAALILMDEPTAHLDRSNEEAVLQRLSEARNDHTLLVVAHRLSTVSQADQIVVIDEGRVVATGRHSELLALSGAYRQLVEDGFAQRTAGDPVAPTRG